VGLPFTTADVTDLTGRRAAHFLSAISRETGATAYFPAALRDLDSVYDRIDHELRTLYCLAYAPSDGRADGQWHRVAVSTPARPNVQIRHRLGYFARRFVSRRPDTSGAALR